MNILQGNFYSTAFRVKDDKAFEADPSVVALRRHMEIYTGDTPEGRLNCITSKDSQPKTMLRVMHPAIIGLLNDAMPSDVVMDDEFGWLATLQKHLHPDDGIVVITEYPDGNEFQTYIANDCAGWTR